MLSRLYCRDFQTVDATLLAPIIEAMKPVANISVESQVPDQLFLVMMFYTTKSFGIIAHLACHFYRFSSDFVVGLPV